MAGPDEVVGLKAPEAEGFRLRDEVRPHRLLPTLTAGFVAGVLEVVVVVATSFAALIFTGPLRVLRDRQHAAGPHPAADR